MEILKNIAYAGVGLATVTSDKVKETINDLVEKGMISDTEGKKIVDDFFTSTDKKREEFEAKFKVASDKITEKLDFFNKDKEIQELNEKINKLEIELQKAKKSKTKKTTTKKTTTKTNK